MLPDDRFKGPQGAVEWTSRATDDDYIDEQIKSLPWVYRAGACTAYSRVYREQGRAEANKRLRQYVKTVNER